MYRRTYGNSPLCPTGHRPFGAAAQKGMSDLMTKTLVKLIIQYTMQSSRQNTKPAPILLSKHRIEHVSSCLYTQEFTPLLLFLSGYYANGVFFRIP